MSIDTSRDRKVKCITKTQPVDNGVRQAALGATSEMGRELLQGRKTSSARPVGVSRSVCTSGSGHKDAARTLDTVVCYHALALVYLFLCPGHKGIYLGNFLEERLQIGHPQAPACSLGLQAARALA